MYHIDKEKEVFISGCLRNVNGEQQLYSLGSFPSDTKTKLNGDPKLVNRVGFLMKLQLPNEDKARFMYLCTIYGLFKTVPSSFKPRETSQGLVTYDNVILNKFTKDGQEQTFLLVDQNDHSISYLMNAEDIKSAVLRAREPKIQPDQEPQP